MESSTNLLKIDQAILARLRNRLPGAIREYQVVINEYTDAVCLMYKGCKLVTIDKSIDLATTVQGEDGISEKRYTTTLTLYTGGYYTLKTLRRLNAVLASFISPDFQIKQGAVKDWYCVSDKHGSTLWKGGWLRIALNNLTGQVEITDV